MQRTIEPLVQRAAAPAESSDTRDRDRTNGASYVDEVLFGRRRTPPSTTVPELGASRIRRADRRDPRSARPVSERS
jgi:hypothetical protein